MHSLQQSLQVQQKQANSEQDEQNKHNTAEQRYHDPVIQIHSSSLHYWIRPYAIH
ncbi:MULTISPECIES: hypothetical protein [Paenibacillus]|uniref:hypothetical protein n=1 Tax=Paenibacillus TaxID=44249 RepID=UPI0015881CE9|nr:MULTISPECIES: hypothetical protein [Paenibacillus]